MTGPSETVMRIRDLRVGFDTPDGRLQAVDGVDLDLRRGEILALVGESGSGKSALTMSLVGLNRGPRTHVSGQVEFRRPQPGRLERGRVARGPRPRRRGRLPGLTRRAQPAAPGGRAGLGDAAAAPAAAPRRSLGARRGAARRRRHRQSVADRPLLPAPALRRHAAARDDRDRARQRTRRADRRRADHRARRHHPGAGAGAVAAAARRARLVDRADHPRSRRGRGGRRPGRGDVCGPGRRARHP